MFRKLQAIEIAEGALLADVAIVFQLLWLYLPVGGEFFGLLVFVVFTILVLRRGFYVALMGLSVALFILIIVTGFHGTSMLFLEGSGGLFLGLTMRWRWHHIPLVLLGATCGTLVLFSLIVLLTFSAGQSFEPTITSLHNTYAWLINFCSVLTAHLGLGGWWKQNVFPLLTPIANFAFRYWLFTFYCLLWLVICPFVAVIYVSANVFVRLFGYDVRPFPGGWLGRQLQRLRRRLLKLRVRMARYVKERSA